MKEEVVGGLRLCECVYEEGVLRKEGYSVCVCEERGRDRGRDGGTEGGRLCSIIWTVENAIPRIQV